MYPRTAGHRERLKEVMDMPISIDQMRMRYDTARGYLEFDSITLSGRDGKSCHHNILLKAKPGNDRYQLNGF